MGDRAEELTAAPVRDPDEIRDGAERALVSQEDPVCGSSKLVFRGRGAKLSPVYDRVRREGHSAASAQ